MQKGVAPAATLLTLSPDGLDLDQELLLDTFTDNIYCYKLKNNT